MKRSTKMARPFSQLLKWVCKKLTAACKSFWKWWRKPWKMKLGLVKKIEEVTIVKQITDGKEEILVIEKHIKQSIVLELGF